MTRRQGQPDRGQATVELALVLPLVVLLLLALIQGGLLVRDQVLVTHAAREAARAAAVDDGPFVAQRAAGAAGPLDAGRLRVRVRGRGAPGSRLRVEVAYESPTRIPLVGHLVGDVRLRATASMRVER